MKKDSKKYISILPNNCSKGILFTKHFIRSIYFCHIEYKDITAHCIP